MVGRQLGLHRRRDPHRPRRAWTTCGSCSPRTSTAGHRSRPLQRGGLPRRHAPRHAGARRPGDGAHRSSATPRDVVRWLRGKGLRFRLMYERQAYEVDGRQRFWGGLAVGTVDGGDGLMAQHRAAARARRDRAPPRRRGRGPAARGRTAPSRAWWSGTADGTRAELEARAVVLAAGGFESDPRCARRSWGRTGTSRRCAGRRTTPARCCARRSRHGAQAYGHWSGCHAIQWDAGAPPTGDRELTNRFSRQSYPVGIVVNATASASSTRARTSATTPTRSTAPRSLRSPQGIAAQIFDAKTVPLLRTIDYEAPGATRVDADTLAELAGELDIDPGRVRAHRRGVQRRDRARPSTRRSRTASGTQGIDPPKSNWALPVDAAPFTASR